MRCEALSNKLGGVKVEGSTQGWMENPSSKVDILPMRVAAIRERRQAMKSRCLVVACFVVVLGGAWGQGIASGAELLVKAVNDRTNEPIGGVRIAIPSRGQEFVQTSDEKGECRIPIPVDRHTLSFFFHAEGFVEG